MRVSRTVALVALVCAPHLGAWAQRQPAQAPAVTAQAGQTARQGGTENDHSLEFWVAHGESDNIADQSNPIEGSYNSVGVVFNAKRQHNRIDLGIATDLAFRQYSVDSLDDERLGNLDLSANVAIVPNRFNWRFQDDYGQRRTNPLLGNTPLNREDYNVVSTGPAVLLPLGGRTTLALRSTYSERSYEESQELESTEVANEVAVIRQVTRTATVGIAVEQSNVDYDLTVPGYEVTTAVLRYGKTLATGSLNAEIGKSQLSFGPLETHGPVVRFSWEHSLTARSRLLVTATREFTDSGALLSLGIGRINAEQVQDVLLSSSPLEYKRAGIRYSYRFERTSLSAALSVDDEAYETAPQLDNRARDFQFAFMRKLTAKMELHFDAGRLKRDFAVLQTATSDQLLSLALDRRFGSRFLLGVGIQTVDRLGQDAFDRTSYEIRWTYRPTGR